jgi:hypothetical protein
MPEYDFRDNLISLGRFSTPVEGAIALAHLKGAGIEGHLSDTAATWLNHVGPDLIGTELLVRQGDVRRAREVLGDVIGGADAYRATDDDEDDEDYWAADWSGEDWADDDDDADEEWSEEAERRVTPPLSRAFRAAVIGAFLVLLLPPVLNLYSCWLIGRHRLWETADGWRYYAAIGFNVLAFVIGWWLWAPYVIGSSY